MQQANEDEHADAGVGKIRTTPVPQDELLATIVAEGTEGSRRKRTRRRLVLGALIVAVVATILGARLGRRNGEPQFHTEEVTRGDLTVTVSATGNLQPTNQVDVGSEVSGLIESVLVDDNDRVKTGQVLARLDISKLRDAVVNMRAALSSAEAHVLQAVASLQEAQANLTRLRRLAELTGGMVPSKSDLETAETTAARAAAEEASARAAVEQARASLSSAETNMAKASIRSPVDGIVLARQIEPGQTVAASFQAPVLFTLAEDLSQMELQVDVDEADVGQVREGQSATFTVDAYPNRTYPASITRVGYGSQTKDGVVSYKAVLTVNNDDLSLRPGMTATAEITTVRRSGVLLVPNASLRFTPPEEAAGRSKRSGSLVSNLLPRPPGAVSKPANDKSGAQKVWVLRDGQPVAVPVTVGCTDGRLTEITGGELRPGMMTITESVGELS
ncbi:MAG: efflux RND transporter periplasmic adaptor subunit [Acidobacteriota bacterium]